MQIRLPFTISLMPFKFNRVIAVVFFTLLCGKSVESASLRQRVSIVI
jgi:hypothetical protein